LIQQEQIARTNIMLDVNYNVDEFFNSLMIQFSYVCLYHGVVPLSSLFICGSNMFIIFMSERLYSTITKRSVSDQVGSIGVWNEVFEMIGFASIVGSALISTYTTPALDKYLNNDKSLALLLILLIDQFIIALKYFIAKLAPEIPRSVKQD
jgi:Calcium-activated chloride channel